MDKEALRSIIGTSVMEYDDSNIGIIIFKVCNQNRAKESVDRLKQNGYTARSLFSDPRIIILNKI